jgi:hypothetical protein
MMLFKNLNSMTCALVVFVGVAILASDVAVIAMKKEMSRALAADVQEDPDDEWDPSYYYHVITGEDELGYGNPDVTIGNPMRGLVPSPRYLPSGGLEGNPLNPSLEFYYIGWDELMIQNPDDVGNDKAYNWTAFEVLLNDSASRYAHVVFRLFIHFPGQPLRLPTFLSNIEMRYVQTGDAKNPRKELSPYYGDVRLLRALENFLKDFGEKYDGDTRIAAIQLGLLGFWGEWQTCCDNEDEKVLSDAVREKVIKWYAAAFKTTKLQMRYADPKSGYESNFGRHDDSFAFKTIEGESYFFWPQTVAAGQDDFWKWGMMGGETRPELQAMIFKDSYQAGSPFKQDFMECVQTTHASYIFHHGAFKNGGYDGQELKNALYAHTRMGYRFRIVKVAAKKHRARTDRVDIEVNIRQSGVAPFYYPLSIALDCPVLENPRTVEGVESLIEKDQEKTFTFRGIPNNDDCLQDVTFTLQSPYIYEQRPMKFSQGENGTVSVSIPAATSGSEIASSSPCIDDHKCKNGYMLSIDSFLGCQEYCVGESCVGLLKKLSWECGPCL